MAKGIKTGGRKAGTPNKATADLKGLCQRYTEEAVTELHRLALHASSEQARVAAINSLLDRGHGKPSQTIGVGQAEDLEPLKADITLRPQITREQWLALHGGS